MLIHDDAWTNMCVCVFVCSFGMSVFWYADGPSLYVCMFMFVYVHTLHECVGVSDDNVLMEL